MPTGRQTFFIKLSEGGTYVALVNLGCGIHIWWTNSGDDTFISITDVDNILDLSLSADLAHLVAVAVHKMIIISDILSSNILQRLACESFNTMHISLDGSLVVSIASGYEGTTQLWSRTRGILLATLEHTDRTTKSPAFSHTNHLYITTNSGGGSVWDMLVEHD